MGLTDYSFERSSYDEVSSFFDEVSRDFDSDFVNPYWAFTHDILEFILFKFITEHFSDDQDIRMFDAGAGTGNWSGFVLGLSTRFSGTLFDMNTSMLRVAYSKLAQLPGITVKTLEGNLEVLTDFPSELSNLILCLNNVIGLGRNIQLILNNLYSHLEDGGLAFIMTINGIPRLQFYYSV